MAVSDSVAYLGPPGTYSHTAALQQFPTVLLTPVPTIAAAFAAVSSTATHAVVPLENSTNGQVLFTYDLLRDWFVQRNRPPFVVVAEQFVAIHHCLLLRAPRVEDILVVYSHPQVWGQCAEWLGQHQLEQVDTTSTARAAELAAAGVADENGKYPAAICSTTAAGIYNVPVLQANIEDDHENTTRFLVIGRDGPQDLDGITLLAFSISHGDPGALGRVLLHLSQHGLNLTSVTSRPLKVVQWQYVFFVELYPVSGRGEDVQRGLDLLGSVVEAFQVVGSFPKGKRTGV